MNRERLLRIRALLRKEFRQLFRDPKAKRIMFGAPLMQLLLFGYAVNTDVHNVPMHVVDYDRTAASRELQDALTAGGYFDIVAVSQRPRELPIHSFTPSSICGRPSSGMCRNSCCDS